MRCHTCRYFVWEVYWDISIICWEDWKISSVGDEWRCGVFLSEWYDHTLFSQLFLIHSLWLEFGFEIGNLLLWFMLLNTPILGSICEGGWRCPSPPWHVPYGLVHVYNGSFFCLISNSLIVILYFKLGFSWVFNILTWCFALVIQES